MPEYPLDYFEYCNKSSCLKEMFRTERRRTIVYFIKAFLYTALFIYFFISLENSNSIYKGFLFAVCCWGFLHTLIVAAVWLLRNILFPFIDGMSGATGCLSGCLGSVLFFGGGTIMTIFLVTLLGGIILVVLDHFFNFTSWITSPRVQYKLIITAGTVLGIVPFIWYWGRMFYYAIGAAKKKKELNDLENVYLR